MRFIYLSIILLGLLIWEINAEVTMRIDIADETTVAIQEYVKNKKLSITHARALWTDRNGQIVGNAACPYRFKKQVTCSSVGLTSSTPDYVMISVTRNSAEPRLTSDVEYRYNDEIMGLSRISNPRMNEMNTYGVDEHMRVVSITVNNVQATYPAEFVFGFQMIIDHGLYIVQWRSNRGHWRNIYFEPYGLHEFIIWKYQKVEDYD